jgi:hypothetical protein
LCHIFRKSLPWEFFMLHAPQNKFFERMMDSKLYSLGLTILFAAISLPLVATAPVNGDGYEVIQTAFFGGAMHPPGFPFQAWINRAFAMLPFGNPATRIALVSFFFHIGSVYFVSEALRLLRIPPIGYFTGAIFWGSLPSMWHAGLIPELFAGGNFFIAYLFYLAVSFQNKKPTSLFWKHPLTLGLAVACAAATHPITLFAAPYILFAAGVLLREPRERWKHFSIMFVSFTISVAVLFGSLPILSQGAAWPNWGNMETLEGIFRHVLRLDYGGFSMTAAGTIPEQKEIGLFHFFSFVGAFPFLTASIAAIGAWQCWRRFESPIRPLIFLGFGASLMLLYFSQLDTAGAWAVAVIERLFGPSALSLSIFFGCVFLPLSRTPFVPDVETNTQFADDGEPHPKRPQHTLSRLSYLLPVAAVALVLTKGVIQIQEVDVSQDQTLPLLMAGIAVSLPEDAFFIATDDADSFGPIPSGDGFRYAIAGGLLKIDWYLDRIWKVEPRLGKKSGSGLQGLVDEVLRQGFPVASAAPLENETSLGQVQGVLYVTTPGNQDAIGPQTVFAALRLCPIVEKLESLPAKGHRLIRLRRYRFARGFDAAGEYLKRANTPLTDRAAKAALEVARGIEDSTDANTWRKGCESFQRIMLSKKSSS